MTRDMTRLQVRPASYLKIGLSSQTVDPIVANIGIVATAMSGGES